ncbi:MAG: hypothetical protein R3195_05615 [Gemmatimonadota bacterium]|nr:hypothetical protein [Gemmatimonadota bacterium]
MQLRSRNSVSRAAPRGRVVAVLLAVLPADLAALRQGSDWTIDPEPRMRAGWLADQPETEFFSVVDVALLPDGAVAVADRGLARVVVIEPDGSLRVAFGGSGDGPGEFAGLSQVFVDGDGHVRTFDTRHQRLTEWTPTGDLAGTTTLTRPDGRSLGAVGRFAGGAWYGRDVSRLVGTEIGEAHRDTVSFVRIGPDGRAGETLARVSDMASTLVRVGGRVAGRHAMFSPRALHASWGDCLLVMAGDEPRIRLIGSGGDLRGEIELDVAVRPTTPADRRAWIDGVIRENDAPPAAAGPIEQMGEALAMADRWPIANRLIADEAGYIWLERYAAPEGSSGDWVVIDGTGVRVAALSMPDAFELLAVAVDRLIGVGSDDLDRQELRVYSYTRDRQGPRAPLSECP